MPDDDFPPPLVPRVLTCRTEGCENAGVGIPVDMPEDGAAACGACGQQITDITEGTTNDE
jgi:hypothetical protein